MNAVTVAAIQPLPVSATMDDFRNGKEIGHALELLEKSAKQGIDIACFSELYPMVGEKELCEKARDLSIFIIAGLIEDTGSGSYNTGTIISPDGHIVGRQRKSFPTSLELDMGINAWNRTYEVFETDIGNIGIVICSDFSFFTAGIRQLIDKKVDIVFNPSWWFAIGEAYSSTVIGRHLEYGVPVVGVDIAKFALKAMIAEELVQFPAAGGYSTIVVPPEVTDLEELSEWFKSMPGGSNSMKGFVRTLGDEEGVLIQRIDIDAVRKFPGYFYTKTI